MDMDSLRNTLKKQTDAEQNINFIAVHLSYYERKTKAELVDSIIKQQKNTGPKTVFSKPEAAEIMVISGVNRIENPDFRKDFNNYSEEARQAAKKLRVSTLVWDRKMPLIDLLKEENPHFEMRSLCNL